MNDQSDYLTTNCFFHYLPLRMNLPFVNCFHPIRMPRIVEKRSWFKTNQIFKENGHNQKGQTNKAIEYQTGNGPSQHPTSSSKTEILDLHEISKCSKHETLCEQNAKT